MLMVPTNNQPDRYMDLDVLKAGFDSHTRAVREAVPKERLLEFDVKQGWEPLCKFLNLPVPNTAFPHVNDRVVVDASCNVAYVLTWIWPFLCLLPVLLCGCCLKCCCGINKDADKQK